MAEVQVVRNVRIPLSLDEKIRRIAKYEDRTISKIMQRLLTGAVYQYLQLNEGSMQNREIERGEL